MAETLGAIQSSLERLERETLAGLDIVVVQLDQVLVVLRDGHPHADSSVRSANERLAEASACMYEEILSCLPEHSPSAKQLRLTVALLNLIPCIARMGEQCAIVATLAKRLDGRRVDPNSFRDSIARMGALSRSQVVRARHAFEHRDPDAVERLVQHDAEIKRATCEMYAFAAGARDASLRERATVVLLIARSLEHIGDGALEIGEQAFLLVNDPYEEASGVS